MYRPNDREKQNMLSEIVALLSVGMKNENMAKKIKTPSIELDFSHPPKSYEPWSKYEVLVEEPGLQPEIDIETASASALLTMECQMPSVLYLQNNYTVNKVELHRKI